MRTLLLKWTGIAATVAGTVLWIQVALAAPPCDQEKAKSATGDCIANAFLCDSQSDGGEIACTSCSCVTVESFPTGCTGNPNQKTNCNQPLAQCTQAVNCDYDAFAMPPCFVAPGSGGTISDAKKPTTDPCA